MEEGGVTEEDEDEEDSIRFVTLESRFEKQGNSLKLVNYKSAMPSMNENGESAVRFAKIFNLMIY